MERNRKQGISEEIFIFHPREVDNVQVKLASVLGPEDHTILTYYLCTTNKKSRLEIRAQTT